MMNWTMEVEKDKLARASEFAFAQSRLHPNAQTAPTALVSPETAWMKGLKGTRARRVRVADLRGSRVWRWIFPR